MLGVTLLSLSEKWSSIAEKLPPGIRGLIDPAGAKEATASANKSSKLFFMIIIGILIFIGILFLMSFLGKAKDKKKDKKQAETLTKIAMGQTQQQTGPVVIKTNNGFAAPPKQPQQKTAVGFGRGDNR